MGYNVIVLDQKQRSINNYYEEDCHLNLYDKLESKHLKKIGHITALDEFSENADLKAKKALSNIKMDVKRSN